MTPPLTLRRCYNRGPRHGVGFPRGASCIQQESVTTCERTTGLDVFLIHAWERECSNGSLWKPLEGIPASALESQACTPRNSIAFLVTSTVAGPSTRQAIGWDVGSKRPGILTGGSLHCGAA
jgi:hypothetical protein